MVNKKINKKGVSTVTTLTISLLIVIGLFNGFFLFYSQQMDNNSLELDEKYGTTSAELLLSQEKIENLSSSLEDSINAVREAEETYLAAINGFKALGQVLLLPIVFTGISIDTTTAMFISTDFIPQSYQSLITVGIILIILFLIVAVLKGEPKL